MLAIPAKTSGLKLSSCWVFDADKKKDCAPVRVKGMHALAPAPRGCLRRAGLATFSTSVAEALPNLLVCSEKENRTVPANSKVARHGDAVRPRASGRSPCV